MSNTQTHIDRLFLLFPHGWTEEIEKVFKESSIDFEYNGIRPMLQFKNKESLKAGAEKLLEIAKAKHLVTYMHIIIWY